MTEVEKLQAHVNLLRRLLKEIDIWMDRSKVRIIRKELKAEIAVALEDTAPIVCCRDCGHTKSNHDRFVKADGGAYAHDFYSGSPEEYQNTPVTEKLNRRKRVIRFGAPMRRKST